MEATEAIERKCIACNAEPGERCTTPTNTGRREVRWTHFAREVDV